MKIPKIPRPNLSKIPKPKLPNILTRKNKKKKNAGLDSKVLKELKKQLETEKKELEAELKQIAYPDKKVKNDYDPKFPSYGSKSDENAMEVTDNKNALPFTVLWGLVWYGFIIPLAKIKPAPIGLGEN